MKGRRARVGCLSEGEEQEERVGARRRRREPVAPVEGRVSIDRTEIKTKDGASLVAIQHQVSVKALCSCVPVHPTCHAASEQRLQTEECRSLACSRRSVLCII